MSGKIVDGADRGTVIRRENLIVLEFSVVLIIVDVLFSRKGISTSPKFIKTEVHFDQ